MNYISFYIDEKGQRFGVDLGTGERTLLDEAPVKKARKDSADKPADVSEPVTTTVSEE